MKRWTQKIVGIGSAALLCTAVVCVAGRLPAITGKNAALTAAGFIMPGGAADALHSMILEEGDEIDDSISEAPSASAPAQSSEVPVFSLPGSSSSGSSPSSGNTSSSLPKKGKELQIGNSGDQYQNVWVKNSNRNHKISIAEELKKQPAVKIVKNAAPQVLIYHTHTTESFADEGPRTRNQSKSVVAVGDQIEAQLKAAGINVVHDTTEHDYPMYNGSYTRSKVTVEKNLKKYPGIQVALDIHRDAMNGLKPTAVVNGKKAAQVMIISGCDDTGTLGFPNWEYNLRLGVRVQQAMANQFPGLARPLNFCPKKYNLNLTKGSLLIEIGTETNTLAEVKYAGELFGKALADVLNKLT